MKMGMHSTFTNTWGTKSLRIPEARVEGPGSKTWISRTEPVPVRVFLFAFGGCGQCSEQGESQWVRPTRGPAPTTASRHGIFLEHKQL